METGTLIYVGVKGSEGRVFMTCSHYVMSNPKEYEEFSKYIA
jgi:hypothetical protein